MRKYKEITFTEVIKGFADNMEEHIFFSDAAGQLLSVLDYKHPLEEWVKMEFYLRLSK